MTEPVGDVVKVAPLNTSEVCPISVGVPITSGPDPISAVSETSSKSSEDRDARRLVTLTFRKKVKLTVMVALGVPPEQLKTMSLVLSVIPSPCTTTGVADGVQVKFPARAAGTKADAIKREKKAKSGRNMGCNLSENSGRGFFIIHIHLPCYN